MLLDDLVRAYCGAMNTSVRSEETVRLINISVDHFGSFLARPAHVEDFTDDNLIAYSKHRRQLGRAETTIERELCKLMSLWRWAANEGLVRGPRVRFDKAEVDTPVAMMRNQIRSLFRTARNYKSSVGEVPGHVFMLALFYSAWIIGERGGALYDMRREHVDVSGPWWRRGWVTIPKELRKRGGKTLRRRLSWSGTYWMRRLLAAHENDRIFGIVHRTTVYHHFDIILKRAKLPKDCKLQCLRRSHASWFERAGGDAQKSLEHKSRDTTVKYYLDPLICFYKIPANLLFDPLSLANRVLAWLKW